MASGAERPTSATQQSHAATLRTRTRTTGSLRRSPSTSELEQLYLDAVKLFEDSRSTNSAQGGRG